MSHLNDGVEHKTLKINGINMHVAEKPGSGSGKDPIILFIHGFPELWYTWRHQISYLSSSGYRTIAPDLRGYGDTESPEKVEDYTYLNVVGDLVALIDAVTTEDEKVFVVGHDWGAMIAWQLCLYRPEKVKALVNMSVLYNPRNPDRVPIPTLRHVYGDDYYICKFQGEIEEEFKEYGTENVLKGFLTYKTPAPLFLHKDKLFEESDATAASLLDETVVLKGLGHFLHEENPDVINEHIHNFFQKFL